MRIFITFALIFVHNLHSANFAQSKALIVTIDQKTLGSAADKLESQGIKALKIVLKPMTAHGALGEAIGLLLKETKSKTLIRAWDDARAQWIESAAAGKYNEIFTVRGDDTRNDSFMKEVWGKALSSYDIIDYVSMVHEGGQIIKDEWQVPQNTNKIRMVYTEACGGGSGKTHFVTEFGALVSAGHNDETKHPSASPLFSFTFLKNWFSGVSFRDSLKEAWSMGTLMLKDQQGFALANFVADYQSKEEAIEGSIIKFAWHAEVDPAKLTINTIYRHRNDGQVFEEVIK